MNCRYCNVNLDRGDVYEVLRNHPLYQDRTPLEISKIAQRYGWSPSNKIRFDRQILLQTNEEGRDPFKICPDCKGIAPLDASAPKAIYSGETPPKSP